MTSFFANYQGAQATSRAPQFESITTGGLCGGQRFDPYKDNTAAAGIDFISPFAAGPRPVPVLTDQQQCDAKLAEKKRKDKARDRSAEYKAKRDKRAFAPSQITLNPNSQHTSDKLARLIGKPNHARSS